MNADFYISPRAITITPNAENNNPDYVGISVVGGTAIRVRNAINVPDGNGGSTRIEIGYAPDLSYRKWTLTGGNTYVGNDHSYALNIYARLDASESGDRGLVMLSKDDKPLETTTETGHYFFLKIGELSAPQQNGLRELTLWDTGELDTNQGINNEKYGDFEKAFELDSAKITPKLPFYGLKLFASSILEFGSNAGFRFGASGTLIKSVLNELSTFTNWASETAIATTASIQAYCRSFFIRKDVDDATSHKLTMNETEVTTNALVKGNIKSYGEIEMAGNPSTQNYADKNYTQGVKGFKLYHNGSGWQLDTDYLFVGKKAYFNEVEIDKVTHVGGQQLLTACGCTVKHVRYNEALNGYFLFFDKEDKDGKPITNDWKVGDLAYCQTFNVKEGTSTGASNRYYWARVLDVTPSTFNAYITDSVNTSERFIPANYHRITIICQNTQSVRTYCDEPSTNINTDGENMSPCINTSKLASDTPRPYDEVVQLGHVKQSNETLAEAEARQGATLLAGAGRWGQALVIWRGIGANASNPFIMPKPIITLSPEKIDITADSIKLASGGVLELSSNQLKCTNLDGQTTLGLDAYGNAFFSGPVNQMSLSASGNKYNVFFEVLNSDDYLDEADIASPYPYSGTGKLLAHITDMNYGATGSLFNTISDGSYGQAQSNIAFLPDMLRLNGIVHLGNIDGAEGLEEEDNIGNKDVDIYLPFCIPILFDQDRQEGHPEVIVGVGITNHFDICRTPTHNEEQHHLITWNELNAIVGRKITFHNNSTSNLFYIKYPLMNEVKREINNNNIIEYEIYYQLANNSYRYKAARLSPGRFVTVEYVAKPVLYKDSYDATETRKALGIFPIVNVDNYYDSPVGYTAEWGNDEIEINS